MIVRIVCRATSFQTFSTYNPAPPQARIQCLLCLAPQQVCSRWLNHSHHVATIPTARCSLSTVMPPFESALSCCCTESVIPFSVLDDSTYVFDPYSLIDVTFMWLNHVGLTSFHFVSRLRLFCWVVAAGAIRDEKQLCASNPNIITAAPQPTSGVNDVSDSDSSTPCESNERATICGDIT